MKGVAGRCFCVQVRGVVDRFLEDGLGRSGLFVVSSSSRLVKSIQMNSKSEI